MKVTSLQETVQYLQDKTKGHRAQSYLHLVTSLCFIGSESFYFLGTGWDFQTISVNNTIVRDLKIKEKAKYAISIIWKNLNNHVKYFYQLK